MRVVVVRWRDACTEDATYGGAVEPGLADLLASGFLAGETDDVLTIASEHDLELDEPGRWRLHIPKSLIIERREVSVGHMRRR